MAYKRYLVSVIEQKVQRSINMMLPLINNNIFMSIHFNIKLHVTNYSNIIHTLYNMRTFGVFIQGVVANEGKCVISV